MTKPDGKQAHKIVHFGDYYNLRLVDTNHGKERQLVLDYGVLEKNNIYQIIMVKFILIIRRYRRFQKKVRNQFEKRESYY